MSSGFDPYSNIDLDNGFVDDIDCLFDINDIGGGECVHGQGGSGQSAGGVSDNSGKIEGSSGGEGGEMGRVSEAQIGQEVTSSEGSNAEDACTFPISICSSDSGCSS